MKFTRNKTPPIVTPPDTFTLELSLDEMIFLKSMCKHYTDAHLLAAFEGDIMAAERFANLIPENPWSWKNTANLFK